MCLSKSKYEQSYTIISMRFPLRVTFGGNCCASGELLLPAHLNVNTTVCCPKFASNLQYYITLNTQRNIPKCGPYSVLMCTSGGFAVAFWMTRNNLVTISITCPVWKIKSPFLRPISDYKKKKLQFRLTTCDTVF